MLLFRNPLWKKRARKLGLDIWSAPVKLTRTLLLVKKYMLSANFHPAVGVARREYATFWRWSAGRATRSGASEVMWLCIPFAGFVDRLLYEIPLASRNPNWCWSVICRSLEINSSTSRDSENIKGLLQNRNFGLIQEINSSKKLQKLSISRSICNFFDYNFLRIPILQQPLLFVSRLDINLIIPKAQSI